MASFNFNYAKGTLDMSDALFLCDASQYVYEGKERIADVVKNRWRFDRFEYIENRITDSQAFVIGNDKMLVLAFRGTEQNRLKDWITDFSCLMTSHPWGMVHTGFLDALDSIWIFIEKAIKEFRDNKQPLWITGHSLGGALAILAAAKCFSRRIGNVYGIYTFGQPRAGNVKFADRYNSLYKNVTFRFVNNEDIITCIPWLPGYEHVGNLCYFDNQGILRKEPSILKRYADQVTAKLIRLVDRSGIANIVFPNEIEDHKLDYYRKFIKKKIING